MLITESSHTSRSEIDATQKLYAEKLYEFITNPLVT